MTERLNQPFKLIIVGPSQSGKTTFIRRHLTGHFTLEYQPTMGVEVHPLQFRTTGGLVRFNMWDCSDHPQFRGMEEGYWEGASGAIVFYDVTRRESLNETLWFIQKLRARHLPIVLCGNKVDEVDFYPPQNSHSQIRALLDARSIEAYFPISAKSNYNFEKPFLCLARGLLGNPNLALV